MKKVINGKISEKSYPCKISKIKHVFATTKITGSTDAPKIGIFWLIDDELVAVSESINKNYNPLASEDVLHIDAWKYLKNRYKVDGKIVKYDYFPRGRVMIYPIKDKDGIFQYYDCDVYGDPCILYDRDVQDEIEAEFRLYLSTCKVTYKGQMSVDGTHYTCHNCR